MALNEGFGNTKCAKPTQEAQRKYRLGLLPRKQSYLILVNQAATSSPRSGG
jgi:hypothetical protein